RPLREWLADLRKLPEIAVYPVTDVVAERAGGLRDPFPGDPADRLVAATALSLDVPLVSQDTKLRGVAALTTIWQSHRYGSSGSQTYSSRNGPRVLSGASRVTYLPTLVYVPYGSGYYGRIDTLLSLYTIVWH